MKNFVKENWYKLMIGCSMFIFSVSALIYSVAPARANIQEKTPLTKSSGSSYQFFVVKGGYLYGLKNGESGYNKSDWSMLNL
jgi:hypothetical protein